jgi:cytochrome P450
MQRETRDAPVMDVNYFTEEWNADPYPGLEAIRAAGPIVFNPRTYDWMVPGYQLGARVQANARRYKAVEELGQLFGGITMEFVDTPLHHELRGVWAKDFQRETLQQQRAMIDEIVATRVGPFVERVLDGETVEAIANMTRGIPVLVIARMLGVSGDDVQRFSDWSDRMGGIVAGMVDESPAGAEMLQRGLDATAELNAFMAEEIAARRARPTDDLVSAMTHSDVARRVSEQDLVASNTQLVFAGNETTAKLMASTLVALAWHPDQRRAIVADRSLVPQAIEEVHRWETVAQVGYRDVHNGDAEIDGIVVPDGSRVCILLGACNRDPARWKDPNRFDIFREPQSHLGFGFGMHSCLGLNLARLELEVWLNQILDAIPEYELAEEVSYGTNFVLRAPLSVHIRNP